MLLLHLQMSIQPTWPQLCACLVFCLFSFFYISHHLVSRISWCVTREVVPNIGPQERGGTWTEANYGRT
jgi:hypothetical protein